MAEFGTPLGVDELLRLSGMAQGYTTERMGRANALRSLTGLSSVSGPSTGIDASLRSLSTATHKDIAARLTDRMLGQRLDNEDQFRGRWDRLFGENYNEFYNEVIEKWRAQVRLGISQASEERAIRDQAIQELELAQKQKLWPLERVGKQQTITKEKQRIKDVDMEKSMSIVALNAARDDIKAIRKGAKYYETVQDRIIFLYRRAVRRLPPPLFFIITNRGSLKSCWIAFSRTFNRKHRGILIPRHRERLSVFNKRLGRTLLGCFKLCHTSLLIDCLFMGLHF